MKSKYLIIMIITILFLNSCDKKKTYHFNYIFQSDYPDYYWDRQNYEITNNLLPKNYFHLYDKFLKDSMNSILLKRNNLKHPDFTTKYILKVLEKTIGAKKTYFFYKHILNDYNDKSILHIEFPLDKNGREKMLILSIINEYKERTHKASYIRWTSKQANLYKHLRFEGRYKNPIYMWGINKTTDTIVSNLSLNNIKKLYPDFNGKFIQKKYKQINIDYNYSTGDTAFFNNIEFVE
jgi:hypothetical protein